MTEKNERERCREQVVWDSWGHTSQCQRAAKVDGFCAQHSREAVAARQAKAAARFEESVKHRRSEVTAKNIGYAVLALSDAEKAALPESVRNRL